MTSQEKFIRIFTGLQDSRFVLSRFFTRKEEKKWIYEVIPDNQPRLCSLCHREAFKHDQQWIQLKDLPMGVEAQEVIVKVRRWIVDCPHCGLRVKEHMPFRGLFGRITKRLEAYIEDLLATKMITVKDVARMFKLDYDLVYRIDFKVLEERLKSLPKPNPQHVAVDEKSFQKGHSYVTIVTDADTHDVIFVTEGRTQESLNRFFKWIGRRRCQAIETIAMDLHKDYHASAKHFCPKALRVPDKFHIVQELNRAIVKVYENLKPKDEKSEEAKTFNKETRWVIRRHLGNQSDHHMATLSELSEKNKPLFDAYVLKDYFISFFDFAKDEIKEAQAFLVHWVTEAWKTKLKPLQDFALYIKRHQQMLLNVIRTGKTSSVSEGINTKISAIKAICYGFHKVSYFCMKIWQRCGTLGKSYVPR